MSFKLMIDDISNTNSLQLVPLNCQNKMICSLAIANDAYSIEHAAYRNTTDWILALRLDYRLAKFYDPMNRSDISPEEFFEIYLDVTSPHVDLLEHLPKFMWLHDTYIRRLILRNPKCIFSVPDQGIVERLLLEYPKTFIDLDLPSHMYSRILPNLLEICGLYVKFYCRDRFSNNACIEITNQDEFVFMKAVSQDGLALEYILSFNDNIVDTALRQTKLAIQFCPQEYITPERLEYCLNDLKNEEIVEKCSPLIDDYTTVMDIVKRQGSLIKYFKKFQDPNLQMIAIEQDPENLQFCVHTRDNLEVRRRAVQLNGRVLRHCGSYKTKELCSIAYDSVGDDCLEYIPSKWREEFVNEESDESLPNILDNIG